VQKPGINYPDLEPDTEFWNRVRVPGSCYTLFGYGTPMSTRGAQTSG